VLTLALLPALAGQQGATVSAAVGGPDVGSQQPSIAWEAPAQMNADLDAMAGAGMTWVRADFYWSAIEYQRGHFAWSATDTFVHAAESRGLRVLAMPDYTPTWARTGPTDKYPPTNPSDYASFAAALAAHYAPMGVHDWEIWNEPNNAMFWQPRADPVAYTAMLKLADVAIKRADPSATVVTGGLSPASDDGHNVAPLTFLSSIYAHGGHGYFDAVGYHPYSYPYAPMYPADWNTFYRTPDVHALVAHYGDGAKQIWGTEVGFPTGTAAKAVSQQMQAQDISAAITQWTSWSFHGPIIFYTIRDLGTNLADVNENMGMVDRSWAPKQVFATVRRQLQAPQDVHATATVGAAAVTWSPPSYDYGRAITGYKIVASPSGASQNVSGDSRSVTFALGNGIAERFLVVPLRGSDAGVQSAMSNEVTPGAVNIVPGVASVAKPFSGTVTMRVPVTLDAPSNDTVTVQYSTASFPPTVNARPGVDYVSTSGTVAFAPRQTLAYVNVTVKANRAVVADDLFLLLFSHPHQGNLGGYFGLGIGLIT
jgi:polysaccharide biosynthesis protein PslG